MEPTQSTTNRTDWNSLIKKELQPNDDLGLYNFDLNTAGPCWSNY